MRVLHRCATKNKYCIIYRRRLKPVVYTLVYYGEGVERARPAKFLGKISLVRG